LAARVVAGDRSALEDVYHRFGKTIKSVALRVVRDESRAEDVTQDTLVGFWTAPERFDPERGSLGSFLSTIAHRRAVDVVRSEVARSRREERPPEPDHYDVAEEVWARTLSDTVRRALDELPKGEREAIALAYLAGLSYVDVAKRLGQPEGTVKSRIRSGMRKLALSLSSLAS
jgi:RNA polymerase sigma-70 factor (ECF subfamily)